MPAVEHFVTITCACGRRFRARSRAAKWCQTCTDERRHRRRKKQAKASPKAK